MPPTRPPLFFDIPAGTPRTACSGQTCDMEGYWIETKAGKRMLVDTDIEGGQEPSLPNARETFAGRGVAHWPTCPDADGFRKPKQGGRRV